MLSTLFVFGSSKRGASAAVARCRSRRRVSCSCLVVVCVGVPVHRFKWLSAVSASHCIPGLVTTQQHPFISVVAGSTENPCTPHRPRTPSRSPPRRSSRPPEPPGPPPNPQRRGLRAGAAARRRRDAFIAHQECNPSVVPVVHVGGHRRPLGTSDEVEIVAVTAANDLALLVVLHP